MVWENVGMSRFAAPKNGIAAAPMQATIFSEGSSRQEITYMARIIYPVWCLPVGNE